MKLTVVQPTGQSYGDHFATTGSILTQIEGLTPDKVSHRLSTLGNNWILGRFVCNSEMERQYLLASGSHPQNS